MLAKIVLCVGLLALFATTGAFRIRNCTQETLDDGETVEDCAGEDIKIKSPDGKVEEMIVFSNDSLDVIQYPDSDDCYVAWKNIQFPDNVEYAQASKEEKAEEASEEMANAVRDLAPIKCTGTVYTMTDLPASEHEAARQKRSCFRYYRCIYYRYRYYFYGRIYIRYRVRCYLLTRCYG